MERLDKFIADQRSLPRSEAAKAVYRGQVTVGGAVCKIPGAKIDPETAAVAVDGQVICYQKYVYLMMNKPQGALSATSDDRAKTVLDLVPPEWRRKNLFPVGRLDIDTVGLLLLTDDGDFAHRILSPKKDIVKRYRALIDGAVTDEDVAVFKSGVVLADRTNFRPAEMKEVQNPGFSEAVSAMYHIPFSPENVAVEIAISEGKYHQIKRMMASVGHKILWLQRISVGGLLLDETLPEGSCRPLAPFETASIF